MLPNDSSTKLYSAPHVLNFRDWLQETNRALDLTNQDYGRFSNLAAAFAETEIAETAIGDLEKEFMGHLGATVVRGTISAVDLSSLFDIQVGTVARWPIYSQSGDISTPTQLSFAARDIYNGLTWDRPSAPPAL